MNTYADIEDLEGILTITQMRALTADIESEEERYLKFGTYIRQATSIINSYVSRRYTISNIFDLPEVPGTLEYRCLSMAKYFALNRVSRIDETTQAQYDESLAWLKALSRGEVDLHELEDESNRARRGYSARDIPVDISTSSTDF